MYYIKCVYWLYLYIYIHLTVYIYIYTDVYICIHASDLKNKHKTKNKKKKKKKKTRCVYFSGIFFPVAKANDVRNHWGGAIALTHDCLLKRGGVRCKEFPEICDAQISRIFPGHEARGQSRGSITLSRQTMTTPAGLKYAPSAKLAREV